MLSPMRWMINRINGGETFLGFEEALLPHRAIMAELRRKLLLTGHLRVRPWYSYLLGEVRPWWRLRASTRFFDFSEELVGSSVGYVGASLAWSEATASSITNLRHVQHLWVRTGRNFSGFYQRNHMDWFLLLFELRYQHIDSVQSRGTAPTGIIQNPLQLLNLAILLILNIFSNGLFKRMIWLLR